MSKRVFIYAYIFIFSLGIIFMINSNFVSAADLEIDGITYNGEDCNLIRNFLNQGSAISGSINGIILNSAYDENDPATWTGVVWSNDTIKRVVKISWNSKSLAGSLDLNGATSLTELYCNFNNLTSLDLSGNTKLARLECHTNQLSKLDISTNTALTDLRCNTNQITVLDVSKNTKLNTLYCHTNQLSQLDISNNTLLKYVYCYSNNLTALDVSKNTEITTLYCYSNQLFELNINSNTKLTGLACNANKLTSLDISKNTALTYLACYSNQLSQLNISTNVELNSLYCYSNRITALDVATNTKLTNLYCNNNQLSKLDVSKNIMLNRLRCDLNKLTELDVSKNTALTELICDSNQLTSLDISSNTVLVSLKCDKNKLFQIKATVASKSISLNSNGNGYIELFISTTDFYVTEIPMLGYSFVNWTETNTNQPVSTETSLNLEKGNSYNIIANFAQITVSFNSQGGSNVNAIDAIYNSKIIEPISPIYEGYIFDGWYKEADCKNKWDFLVDVVKENTILYAKWILGAPTNVIAVAGNNQVTVSFTAPPNEANIEISYTVTSSPGGISVTGAASPLTVTGLTNGIAYTFIVTTSIEGKVTGVSSIASNAVTPTEPDVISTTPAAISLTVEFNVNGGSIVSDISNVTAGSTIAAPTAPTKKGYIFAGWYKEATCINEWNFATDVVSANITLHAKWVAVNESLDNGGPKNESTDNVTNTQKDESEIIINGKTEIAARTDIEIIGRQMVVTVKVDNLKTIEILEREGEDSKVIIPIINVSTIKVVEINGQTIKKLEANASTLEIKTDNITYVLPATQFNIDKVSKELGSQIELKDIVVKITVSDSSEEVQSLVENIALKYNYGLVTKPVEFNIACINNTKTVDISKFNSYVERMVAIPEGVDPSKITTGVVVNNDGTFSHVPTTVVVIDGKYFAKINSLTNSTYTVIWNPVTFKDVENHWGKDYVNEVGSRLIDSGIGDGNFAPNRAIIRAEFASMIVKALGLKGTKFTDDFSDVKKDNPYYYYIYTAYEYGILSGYTNGKFGVNDLITREQAMTMLAKAMKIAGMDVSISQEEITSQLKLFKDSGKISSYAKEGATICIKSGIFVGDNKGRLTPKDSFTRAESATVIIKLLEKAELI